MPLAGCFGRSKKLRKHELLSRSSLETHQLDLMAENSSLKLRMASLEKSSVEVSEKLLHAQRRMEELQCRLNEKSIEVADLRSLLIRNGTTSLPSSPERSDSFRERAIEKEKTLERLKRKHSEVDKLKNAIDCLMVTNAEKDKHIDELGRLLKNYRKMEDLVLAGHKDQLSVPEDRSDTSSNKSAPLSDRHQDQYDAPRLTSNMAYPEATSTPVTRLPSGAPHLNGGSSPISNIGLTEPPLRSPIPRSTSCEDISPPSCQSSSTSEPFRGGLSYAQTETDDEALKDEMAQQYKAMQQSPDHPPLTRKKSKGLKRFFGKLRRSNSQEIDPENLEEFKRNALRSTAGGRVGGVNSDSPFASWDCDRIAMWLHAVGLSMYVGECRRWVKTGQQLLRASTHELEKELGIKSHFHKKKLQLALQRYGGTTTGSPPTLLPRALDMLDHNFVTRWLDDIGLPQYKDAFTEARVDGRMLHYLTVEDLMLLKVTSSLHHMSIRRGIQVLRNNEFNPACLKRRPDADQGQPTNCPEEVVLWTNHRVMEWLKSIDLSEYAPNMRGSGVHGGLMVLEEMFSAEIFAAILSIPPSKTLLRRHLTTHFVSLVGNGVQQQKREVEASPNYTPLTPNQKVKVKKHGLFSHKRTRSSMAEDDLVCPITDRPCLSSPHQNGGPAWRKDAVHSTESSDDRSGVRDSQQDGGYYVQEYSALTTMLARDRHLLDGVPTSDV